MKIPEIIPGENIAKVFDAFDTVCDNCESNTMCNECCIEKIRREMPIKEEE